jgi:demethylmenaquinone methyltransferase/2-methoxy-6-polyprenyl-1,4-benzoquinol methylase
MSTLALMRWLEETPDRYDAGMRLVTLGRVGRLHDAVAEAAVPRAGARVLEIGCGTGSVTKRLLERGAEVVALDQDAAMLERARQRNTGPVEWLERTASEIDALEAAAFDGVVLSLSLSEMSSDERRFVLAESVRRLRPGGRLVVADEVRAEHFGQRLLQRIARAPQWLLAWLLAGSISQVIPDLRAELEACGVEIESERRWLAGSLALFVCRAPGRAAGEA